MKTIHEKNIEEYASLYKSDNSSKSYEVRVKVNYIKKILPKLRKRKSILEIGYGTGDLLHEIYKSYPYASICALEVIDEAKMLYKKRFPHDASVHFYTSDVEEKLPFKSNFFDLVVFSHVLEHIENEDFFLKEILRVIKKGGVVIIAVPEWEGSENHLHFRQYNKSRLEEVSKKYSLKMMSIQGDGYYMNKLYYLLLHLFLNSKRNTKKSHTSAVMKHSSTTYLIRFIYYSLFVNSFLLINRVDNILFRHLDRKPMQWVAVYKKK